VAHVGSLLFKTRKRRAVETRAIRIADSARFIPSVLRDLAYGAESPQTGAQPSKGGDAVEKLALG